MIGSVRTYRKKKGGRTPKYLLRVTRQVIHDFWKGARFENEADR